MRGLLFSLIGCLAAVAVSPAWSMTPQEILERRLQKMQEADAALRSAEQREQELKQRAKANAPAPTFHKPEKLTIPDPIRPAGATPDPKGGVWDRRENTPPAAAPATIATPSAPKPPAEVPPVRRDTKKAAKLAVKAAKAAKAGRFKTALDKLDQAIAADPADPELFNNRGNVLANSGRLQDALADYDRAIAMRPSNPAFFTNRGYAYERLGNRQQACDDYVHACDLGDCAFFKSYKAEGHCPQRR